MKSAVLLIAGSSLAAAGVLDNFCFNCSWLHNHRSVPASAPRPGREHAKDFAAPLILPRRHRGDFDTNELYNRMSVHINDFPFDEMLKMFDYIGRYNNGNRGSGTRGFDISSQEIHRLTNPSPTFTTRLQEYETEYEGFSHSRFRISYYPMEDNSTSEVEVIGPVHGVDTPLEGINAKLVFGIEHPIKGCHTEDYWKLGIVDKIVVQPMAPCLRDGEFKESGPDGIRYDQSWYEQRAIAASRAGAAAVIFYNDDEPLEYRAEPQIWAPDTGNPMPIPIGFINKEHGREIKYELNKNQKKGQADGIFQMSRVVKLRKTRNVFSDSNWGDEKNMIVVGAHLDSLRSSRGVNDNASGATLLLALFNALQNTGFAFNNKIRFAWWGGGINGLPKGSEYYMKNMNMTHKPMAYLNFEKLLDKVDPDVGVLQGASKADAAIADLFRKWYAPHPNNFHSVKGGRKTLDVTRVPIAGIQGEDYTGFANHSIPVSGLTSVVHNEDPCIGRLCDKYKKGSGKQLRDFTHAAAFVLSELAVQGPRALELHDEVPA